MTELPENAVAIVGLAGRFPGAAGPAELWENTLRGLGSVTRRRNESGAVEWARGELADVASFDPAFFGMSSRDALILDPQHRILLECAWEALADAGVDGDDPIRRTAVFAAANYSGYRELLTRAGTRVGAVEFESGNDKDFLATTIAYRLGLEGPCMTVQTACSSSLVAVHLACQTLLEYDADQALAGGVSIVLPHTPGWRFEPSGIHSAEGVCRPFDAAADGTVMGDGAGMVVLRRLQDAVDDGCRIYAVLRGSAVNNDGSRKIGYAAPSVSGQAEVIRTAHARSGVAPADIGYVETHGTGTPLGDQVEFQALSEAFALDAPGQASCALSSAKGALGHLDTAAGVVGLIRASMALHHATLPGTVNHHVPHPGLRIKQSPFFIPAVSLPWESKVVRRAGVSSFGVGGTNAHVVLEEFVPAPGQRPTAPRVPSGKHFQRRTFWPSLGPDEPLVAYRNAAWREWTVLDRRQDRGDYSQIVLLADADDIGERLCELFQEAGVDVRRAGSLPELRHELDAACHVGPVLLVCAWALSEPDRGHRGYDTLVALASQFSTRRVSGGIDVVMLTREVCPVTGDEAGDPALATLTGLARVISMEAPGIRVRVLDLADTDRGTLADVTSEALHQHAEPIAALRGRRWWIPTFDEIQPDTTMLRLQGASSEGVRRSGVCVVLGAGTVGIAAAGVLARAGRPVIVAARPGAGLVRAGELVRELAAVGAEVSTEVCDSAQASEIEALLNRATARFGAVDQIVLAAGISGEAAYQETASLREWDEEEHFHVKVSGVAALRAACLRHPIRRVVLMSSLAGVLGAISLGPYAAAAAAMDCHALQEEARGSATRWLSVGWDAWHHDDAAAGAHERAMVKGGFSPSLAEEALAFVLLTDIGGHLLVTRTDFPQRWDRFVRQPLTPTRASQTTGPDPVTEPRIPGEAPGGHRADLSQLVLDAWRDCLDEPALALDDDVLLLGADSLNSIDVQARLSEQLGRSLPADLFFDAGTPRLHAEAVGRLLGETENASEPAAVRQWHVSGPTVWCLPPISGSAEDFARLAELLPECQVRTVAGASLADVGEGGTIEGEARRHHALLSADGQVPTAIVGWSYGGVVAFAVAHLVLAETGRAPSVIVLDMPAPTVPGRRSITEVGDSEILLAISHGRSARTGSGSSARVAVEELLPDTGDDERRDGRGLVLARTVDRLRELDAVSPNMTVELASRLAVGYRSRMRAVERYSPPPYPGALALVCAQEPEFGDSAILQGVVPVPEDDPSWGWSALAERGCARHLVDGHHSTLLTPPSVQSVARIIQSIVSKGF